MRSLRPPVPAAALLLLTVAAASASGHDDAPILGFSSEAAAEQRALEERFDRELRADNLRSWMEEMTAHPHPVGSPWGRHNAELMAELLRSWGYQVEIEEFRVLFPTPNIRRVEMLEPEPFVARLEEPAVAGDRTSQQPDEILPTYNAYSADGDVTGELVFVGYGLPEDYDELARRGVDVAGRIVLARYGRSWRGIKPKVAAEHGAVGCILYSDPEDDGYFQGEVYPEGGYRPTGGAQRGSVADMPKFPGDPLTPFVGATRDAERVPLEEAETLTKIPVLPISAADAEPLLAALEGPMAPADWRGGLPLPYRLGPGPARVRLHLEFDWSLASAYDVIARLEGTVYPEQWILRGNHHDAWVSGATDPVSGMVALLEEARAVGRLAATGWRPKRTLVYAAWDAEEPGLLGSVEWAEKHAEELSRKAVAYLNSDSNGRGYFYAAGSHTLERFINQIARELDDPVKGVSLLDRNKASVLVYGDPDEKEIALGDGDLPIPALGSGSDYTPFLQHLGIASLNLGFRGEGHYGQYHSAYDSFDHYVRFMDPTFEYGIALARVGGRAMLRLSEAEILPFEFTALARTVAGYAAEVQALPDALRAKAEERNRLLDRGAYEAVSPPDEPIGPPPRLAPVPHLNFAPLANALDRLEASAAGYDRALAAYGESGRSLDRETAGRLARALYRSERALTREKGLPGRPWYVHHLYAPGFYTGYGVKTLPGVREAIEAEKWREAGEQIEVLASVLDAAAAAIDEATGLLTGGSEDR